MSTNDDIKENEPQISIKSEFNELNISDKDESYTTNIINHENCYDPPEKLWYKECVPDFIIKGKTNSK